MSGGGVNGFGMKVVLHKNITAVRASTRRASPPHAPKDTLASPLIDSSAPPPSDLPSQRAGVVVVSSIEGLHVPSFRRTSCSEVVPEDYT